MVCDALSSLMILSPEDSIGPYSFKGTRAVTRETTTYVPFGRRCVVTKAAIFIIIFSISLEELMEKNSEIPLVVLMLYHQG